MIKFQYNKTSLQQIEKSLKMRQRTLPIIKNKETALRLEVKQCKEEADAHFNEYNYKNIDEMLKLVSEAMTNMLTVLIDIDNTTPEDLMRNYNKEREINNFRNACRTENIENVNQHKYPYKAGIFYMDIVCETEKLGDFIVNVIDSVEDIMRSNASPSNPLDIGELNPEKTAKPVV